MPPPPAFFAPLAMIVEPPAARHPSCTAKGELFAVYVGGEVAVAAAAAVPPEPTTDQTTTPFLCSVQ